MVRNHLELLLVVVVVEVVKVGERFFVLFFVFVVEDIEKGGIEQLSEN